MLCPLLLAQHWQAFRQPRRIPAPIGAVVHAGALRRHAAIGEAVVRATGTIVVAMGALLPVP
ncbi:hypothetical protein ATR1_067c0054 [Acetobacter tropicalis]|nr:hypothetical protein ATR1_067c0054 [Acetobacter tropicalis]